MLVKAILILFWLIIIPYVLGKFLVKEEENKMLYTWILGHVLQMGVFFIISIPMILLRWKFTTLLYTYSIVILILAIISGIVNRKKFSFGFKNISWKEVIKKVSIYQIIFFVILGTQLYTRFKYTSINDDDSSFVTLSTSMIHTDKMFLHSMEGNEQEKIVVKRSLAPLSAYYAAISKQVGLHVTVLMHTVMPIILICIAYILYYYFAKKLFNNKDSIFIFLIFIALLSLYAFEVKGYNKYFFLYTWFGRAILAAIILPFIWKTSFDAMNKEKNKPKDWITMFTLVNSACLCTEMAVPLTGIAVMALALVNSIRDKKITYIFKSLLCILPCIIIGFIYLKIK